MIALRGEGDADVVDLTQLPGAIAELFFQLVAAHLLIEELISALDRIQQNGGGGFCRNIEVEVVVGEPLRLFGQTHADDRRTGVQGEATITAERPLLLLIHEHHAERVPVAGKALPSVEPGRRDRLTLERVGVVGDGEPGRVEKRQGLHSESVSRNHTVEAVLPPEPGVNGLRNYAPIEPK